MRAHDAATEALMRQIAAYVETVTDLPADIAKGLAIGAVAQLTARLSITCALAGIRCVWGFTSKGQDSPAADATAPVSGASPIVPGTAAADAVEAAEREKRAKESDVIGQLGDVLAGRIGPMPKLPGLPS